MLQGQEAQENKSKLFLQTKVTQFHLAPATPTHEEKRQHFKLGTPEVFNSRKA